MTYPNCYVNDPYAVADRWPSADETAISYDPLND